MYSDRIMEKVSSSNIDSVGYDPDNRIVYVKFLNGSIYAYKDVPRHDFDALRDAPSVGSYLHRGFKNVYPYEKIG